MCLRNVIQAPRPATRGVTSKLPDILHALIRCQGISLTRPTLRGKRGGQSKQRDIPTRITARFDATSRAVNAASANIQLIAPVILRTVNQHGSDDMLPQRSISR